MILSAIFFFISLLLFSKAFNSFTSSLLFSSLLLSLTPISNYNIHILLIILSIIVGLLNNNFTLIRTRFFIFLLFSTLSFIILSFSFSLDLVSTLGKMIKIIAITLPISLKITNPPSTISYNKVLSSFIVLSILGIALWFTINKFDSGIAGSYRLPSISYDPNYSAIILLSTLFIYKSLNIRINKKHLVSFFILISLTQSISSISIGILIFIFFRSINKKPNLYFYFLIISIILYISFVFYISKNQLFSPSDSWQDNYISMKMNSLYFRMRAQFMGAEMLDSDPIHFLYGYGSGKSLIFFDRVMHNSYMQILFDHGVLFLLFIILYFNFLIKKSSLYVVFLYLQVMSFMFDSYFMGLLPLTYILFIILKSSNNNRAKHA